MGKGEICKKNKQGEVKNKWIPGIAKNGTGQPEKRSHVKLGEKKLWAEKHLTRKKRMG